MHAEEIKHRFLAGDEAGHRIVFIDENNPANDWEISTENKGRAWDMQLIGNDQVSVSFPNGYHILDLNKKDWIKTVPIKDAQGVWSVLENKNGEKSAIGFSKNLYVATLDESNNVTKKGDVPKAKMMRLGRLTSDGNAVAAPGDEVIEWNANGEIIKRFDIPYKIEREKGLMAFMGLEDKDGNYWAATGYGAVTVKTDSNGNLLKVFGKDQKLHFTAGFQLMPNGNLVQCNWSGHTPAKASAGVQIVEFNPDGEVVWEYSNPKKLSCPVTVIVLDNLNTKMAASDQCGVLKNF